MLSWGLAKEVSPHKRSGSLGRGLWKMYSMLPAAKMYSSSHGHCSASQPAKGPCRAVSNYSSFKFHSPLWWRLALSCKADKPGELGHKEAFREGGRWNFMWKKSPEAVLSWGREVPRKIQTPKSRTRPFHSNILTHSQESSGHSKFSSHFYIYHFQISRYYLPFNTPSTLPTLLSRDHICSVRSRYPSGVRQRRAEGPHLKN